MIPLYYQRHSDQALIESQKPSLILSDLQKINNINEGKKIFYDYKFKITNSGVHPAKDIKLMTIFIGLNPMVNTKTKEIQIGKGIIRFCPEYNELSNEIPIDYKFNFSISAPSMITISEKVKDYEYLLVLFSYKDTTNNEEYYKSYYYNIKSPNDLSYMSKKEKENVLNFLYNLKDKNDYVNALEFTKSDLRLKYNVHKALEPKEITDMALLNCNGKLKGNTDTISP